MDRSTMPPGRRCGPGGHGGEPAVGIGRGDETARGPARRRRETGRRSRGQELVEAGPAGLVEDDMDDGGPFAVGFVDHLAFAVDGGQDVTAVEGDEELDHPVGHPEVDARGRGSVRRCPGRYGPRRPRPRDGLRPPVRARPPRSALFTTRSSGTSPAPISSRTRRTASIWASGSGAEPSTTWSRSSASRTSSRVERKASTSWWGSLRTKPTVSERRTVSPPGRARRRVRGSRVEKGRLSTRTPASVRRLSRVDLPALV